MKSERALTYRRQPKATNTQNTKSDSSVKLPSPTALTPSIQSFPEANSHPKFSILKHPIHSPPCYLPDLVLYAERASTNPATTNQSSLCSRHHRTGFTVVESHRPLTQSSESGKDEAKMRHTPPAHFSPSWSVKLSNVCWLVVVSCVLMSVLIHTIEHVQES
jgi:hypothetical protein